MTTDCNPIKGINIKFRQHALAKYWHAHHKLNSQYSAVITDVNDIFDKNANVPALIAAKLVHSTNLPTDEDKAKVKQMINNGAMILRWHLHDQNAFMPLTTSELAFHDAREANKFLCLAININGLHFKENFRPNTFAEISTKSFPGMPTTPVATPANPSLNTPVTLVDLANMIAQVSPGGTTNNCTPPSGDNQTQQTGNIVNPSSLPPEV